MYACSPLHSCRCCRQPRTHHHPKLQTCPWLHFLTLTCAAPYRAVPCRAVLVLCRTSWSVSLSCGRSTETITDPYSATHPPWGCGRVESPMNIDRAQRRCTVVLMIKTRRPVPEQPVFLYVPCGQGARVVLRCGRGMGRWGLRAGRQRSQREGRGLGGGRAGQGGWLGWVVGAAPPQLVMLRHGCPAPMTGPMWAMARGAARPHRDGCGGEPAARHGTIADAGL